MTRKRVLNTKKISLQKKSITKLWRKNKLRLITVTVTVTVTVKVTIIRSRSWSWSRIYAAQVCTCIHRYIHTFTGIYTHSQVYTYIHRYIHAFTGIYMHSSKNHWTKLSTWEYNVASMHRPIVRRSMYGNAFGPASVTSTPNPIATANRNCRKTQIQTQHVWERVRARFSHQHAESNRYG